MPVFELLTGSGLAMASGLRAFAPMLVIGLVSRFSSSTELPAGWAWLENPWVLALLGLLVALELIADKVPGVDTVSDVVQTFVRPAAGGIVFSAGSASQTVTVTDPAAFFTGDAWVPFAIGAALALLGHASKAIARAAVNALSLGTAAPVLSTVEDATSVGLSFAALLLPLLALAIMIALVWAYLAFFRRMRRLRARTSAQAPPGP